MRIGSSLILILLLFFSLGTTTKQLKIMENSLYYISRAPKSKIGNPPIVILMHGVGSNERDLFSFADQLPDDFLVISLRAPYSYGQDSYAWYEVDFSTGKPIFNKSQAEKSRNLIIDFIDQLKTKEKFDSNQVYLCGFSQGAIMAYSVGLTKPDKIKGIAAMSGRMLEEVKPLILPNDSLKKLKIFISHGINDPVLGIHYARESNLYLKQLGLHPTYKEYGEVHTINSAMLKDLIVWLKE